MHSIFHPIFQPLPALPQSLLTIAGFPSLGYGFVAPFAMAELPKRNRDASQAAQMYGRLDLLHSLLATHRSLADLSVPEVLKFSKLGLDMPDEKVCGHSGGRPSPLHTPISLFLLRLSIFRSHC